MVVLFQGRDSRGIESKRVFQKYVSPRIDARFYGDVWFSKTNSIDAALTYCCRDVYLCPSVATTNNQ